jgi:hypothetical protein
VTEQYLLKIIEFIQIPTVDAASVTMTVTMTVTVTVTDGTHIINVNPRSSSL